GAASSFCGRDRRAVQDGAHERSELGVSHEPFLRPALYRAGALADVARGRGGNRDDRARRAADRLRAGGGRLPPAPTGRPAQPVRASRGTAAARARRDASAPRAARVSGGGACRANTEHAEHAGRAQGLPGLTANKSLLALDPRTHRVCAWVPVGSGLGIDSAQDASAALRCPISDTIRAGSTETTTRLAAERTPGGTGMSLRRGR